MSTLQFVISNPDPVAPVSGLAFSDPLPSGVSIATPASATSTCGGVVTAPDGGSTISFSDGGVGASGSCSITVNVTSSAVGVHSNLTGDLSSSAGNSGPATADLTVATDRPGFTKSFSPAAVSYGGHTTLTLTIDNTANSADAYSLSFTDNLPTGMVIASPVNAVSTCGSGGTLTAVAGSSVVKYATTNPTIVGVAAGASCSISVDVLANSVGVLGNVTGELSSSVMFGPARSSGKASAALVVSFEQLSLTKSFLDDPVAPGGTVTLEFTVRNLDRRSSATAISFTDDLDSMLSGLAAVGPLPANPCGSGSTLSGSGALTLSGGSLGVEESCTFGITLQVPSGAVPGTYTNTTGSITAMINGSMVTGNPASDFLYVQPVPVLTKSFTDDPVGAGGQVTLEFTITNSSQTSSATDIAFQDVFVDELPTATVVPASGFCGGGSTATYTPLGYTSASLVVSGAGLAAGASCTFSLTLDVAVGAAAGVYDNTTSAITATVDGEVLTGNPASDSLVVVATPTLYKAFTDDPVAPGDTVTLEFTLSHDEIAPDNATNIEFNDNLASMLTGLAATGTPLADVCGTGSTLSGSETLSFTGGSLAPGGSCTFSVSVQVPGDAPAGTYGNTTSNVTATIAGVSATGNPASDDLRIAGLTLSKEFIDDPVLPGGTVTLRFTIANTNPVSAASDIFFSDNLDSVIDNLAASGLPLNDICGTGSSLTGSGGDTLLVFQGGSLASGEQCSFDVSLLVPVAAVPDTYRNTTSQFSATVDGSTVLFDNATDKLTVSGEVLLLLKEFTNDPVPPGGSVNLRFTLANLNPSLAVSDIAFSDNLDAALEGLVSTSGSLSDVCGSGSSLSGSDLLIFNGGSLAAGASCSFDVSLSVPSQVPLGSSAVNTTSEVTGTISGTGITADPASDELHIDYLTFSKSFAGEVTAGSTVNLSFTISNLSATLGITDLSFSDDLDGVITGMAAIGLPVSDVCGSGSMLSGSGFLTLSSGNLPPMGSCTFSVDVQVPGTAAAGSYLNVTSELLQYGTRVAAAASAVLIVDVNVDHDEDGVLDGDDLCPGTVIPEGVPTVALGTNRYALVDDDLIFDTKSPNLNAPYVMFTTTDTVGCSCEQIIAAMGLGQGHVKFGCSIGVMREWTEAAGYMSRPGIGTFSVDGTR